MGPRPFTGLKELQNLRQQSVARASFQLSLRSNEFWQQLAHLLRPLLMPYIVGSMIGCTMIAAIAYPLALAFVRRRRGLPLLKHEQLQKR